jgi:hypothetical protein
MGPVREQGEQDRGGPEHLDIRVPAVFDLSMTPPVVTPRDRDCRNTDDTDLRNQHG